MKFTTSYRKRWLDVFPPDHLLQGIADKDVPVLVDIGGGIGTDILEFRRRYPQIRGQLILQDQPAVIESAKEKNGHLLHQVSAMQTAI